jgi:hypothetical protein
VVALAQCLRELHAAQAFIKEYPGSANRALGRFGLSGVVAAAAFPELLVMTFIIRAGIQILADHPRLYSGTARPAGSGSVSSIRFLRVEFGPRRTRLLDGDVERTGNRREALRPVQPVADVGRPPALVQVDLEAIAIVLVHGANRRLAPEGRELGPNESRSPKASRLRLSVRESLVWVRFANYATHKNPPHQKDDDGQSTSIFVGLTAGGIVLPAPVAQRLALLTCPAHSGSSLVLCFFPTRVLGLDDKMLSLKRFDNPVPARVYTKRWFAGLHRIAREASICAYTPMEDSRPRKRRASMEGGNVKSVSSGPFRIPHATNLSASASFHAASSASSSA